MTNAIECPSCAQEMSVDDRFCGGCGASLFLRCPGCEAENPPTFRFCSSCGSGLGTGQPIGVGEAARLTEARRWVTVLFADLSGFTSISERMDPEDVTAMVDHCLRELGAIVESFGGYVEKVVGDEIMALFGAPVSHEDDAERAVRAGLEMQACASDAGEQFAGLRLRVGVNTGEVMFAPVGPETARRFTVMGDVVNTAARLEAAAPIGGVLVGEETHRAAQRSVRFDAVEPVRAKNKEQPVEAWLAVEAVSGPAERPAAATPLVGREREVAVLRSTWERVVTDQRSHLFTVLGPPGIGKSRLVREVLELLAPAPAVLHGRCLPYGDVGGYAPFVQQVKQAADLNDTLDGPAAAGRLRDRITSLIPGPDGEVVADHLSVLAGIRTDARVDKPMLYLSARRFIEAFAAETPTVLVFEDIHWADAALLDLIESLAVRVRDATVLFLCVARPELHDARPQWAGGVSASTGLPLEPLSDEDTAAMVRHLTGVHDRPDIDVRELSVTAGGNPLFIEELVSSVMEGLAGSVSELPTTVRGIIAARLDALPAAARNAVFDASVVGKVFWRTVVETLGGPTVGQGIEMLEQRDFIRREPVSRLKGDEELIFRHVLTRDVAYGMIPKATRRQRHAMVARALESMVGDRAGEWAAGLAYHHREAGHDVEAARYLEMAADTAGRAWAKDEAIALCDQALALVPPHEDQWRDELLLRKATLLADRGDCRDVLSLLSPLLDALSGERRVSALLLCARAAFWLADNPTARHYCEQATALAETLGDRTSMGAALAVRMLTTSAAGELHEGLAIADKALSLLEGADRSGAVGHHTVEYSALVLAHRGLHHYWLAHHAESAVACRRSYEIGLAEHHVETTLASGAQYGMALAALGRYEDAFRVLADVIANGEEMELLPRLTGRAVAMWAGALRELQDLDGARTMNEEAAEMGRRAAFPNTQVQSVTDLLLLDLLTGDVGSVQTQLPVVVAQAEALRGWHQWLLAGRLADVTARFHLATGDHAGAAEAAEASIRQAAAVGRAKYEASGRMVLAEALTGLGRLEEARGHAQQAHRIAVAIEHLPTMWETADMVSRLAEAVGDDDLAASAGQAATDALTRCAAGLHDERRSAFLAAPRSQELLRRARP